MMRNSLTNINLNKGQYDKLNSQLSSQKKIQRASEDPIVAIRALRLRATYADINQYLEKNIPDAQHWLEATETALNTANSLLEEFIYYCNQGVSDYNTVNEREILYNQLKQYRDEIYSSANADYAGRTVFTGYKTDRTFAFEKDDLPRDYKYEIEQQIAFDEIDVVKRISGGVDWSDVKEVHESDVQNKEIYRAQLAYKDIDAGVKLDDVNFPVYVSVNEKSLAALGDAVYNVNDNEVVIIPETGEILFGKNAYSAVKTAGGLTATYRKTGFDEGDIRPEHYFNCTDMSDADQDRHVKYTISDQKMDYNINFNQTITVNTLGKDVYSTGMSRKIDDIMEAVNTAIEAQKTVENIERQISETTDETTLENLNSMLKAAQLQLAYAEENMSDVFSGSITYYQKYQEQINLAIADIGSKDIRLSLNQTRLEAQELSVSELKSENEEVNITEVAVQLQASSDVYDASLAAAAKVIQKSLLDFL